MNRSAGGLSNKLCLPRAWLRPNQSVTRPTPWPSFSDRFTTTCEGNIPNGSSQAASLPCAIFTRRAWGGSSKLVPGWARAKLLNFISDLKLVRRPRALAPTLVTNASPARTLDHSHCPVLAPATLAALPSTRTIPDRTCSMSLIPFASFAIPEPALGWMDWVSDVRLAVFRARYCISWRHSEKLECSPFATRAIREKKVGRGWNPWSIISARWTHSKISQRAL